MQGNAPQVSHLMKEASYSYVQVSVTSFVRRFVKAQQQNQMVYLHACIAAV